jgi:peroxiredoxin Q/BCP
MIDPLKATKGRRMSKKTRKKSPKAAPKKMPRVVSKTSAKKPGSKTSRTSAKPAAKTSANTSVETSAKKSVKAKASPAASHKATSKKLKAPASKKSAPAAAMAVAENRPQAHPTLARSTGGALTEGARAPGFQLPRDGGSSVSVADYAGQKLVIFFYPRADTPGCTKEAIDFTRLSGAFADGKIAVLGVSADPLKAQESFRDKHQLSIPLASDETHAMLQAYGVWGEKSMYGKTFLGILRTTVLVDAKGKVAKIWRNVKVDGHADEVLAAAQAL